MMKSVFTQVGPEVNWLVEYQLREQGRSNTQRSPIISSRIDIRVWGRVGWPIYDGATHLV